MLAYLTSIVQVFITKDLQYLMMNWHVKFYFIVGKCKNLFSVAKVLRSFSPLSSSITRSDLNFALKFLLFLDMTLAVENAVVSPLSNGFVEGINNRTKMIKRVMYGRCGIDLLSAKIILPYAKNG